MLITIALLGLNLSTISTPAVDIVPTEREMEMIDEINYVRTNPKDYIQYIDSYLEYWDSAPSEIRAAKELEKVLSSMEPLDSLVFSQEIYNQCHQHTLWMERTGRFDHSDYDFAENLVSGDQAVRMAMLSLLIDDGIPSRGHRTNILDPEYKTVACAEVEGLVGSDPFVFVQGFDF